MSDIVEAIVSLFEYDIGLDFSHNERMFAQRKYDALADTDKAFLCGLSKEDLENVCIGEVREDEEPTWFYNGEWQKLPPAVENYLTEIWETVI